MEEKEWIVYQHRRKDTGEIFYIGIGRKYRPYIMNNRNKMWKNIVNKTDYDIEIVNSFDNRKDAENLEIQLIKKYGRRDLGLGTLVNMTDGGDGCEGRVWTKEQLISKGKKIRGEKNGMFGRKWSEDEIKIFSKLSQGTNNKNSKLTEQDVIWIRKNAVKGHKGNIVKIAEKFNVNRNMIIKILNRKNWTHI